MQFTAFHLCSGEFQEKMVVVDTHADEILAPAFL